MPKYPTTPDGRYFVVKGRLWRAANPGITDKERSLLQKELMAARRKLRKSHLEKFPDDEPVMRAIVQKCKVALGERGPVWWSDGSLDYNRRLVKNTPYAEWYAALGQ